MPSQRSCAPEPEAVGVDGLPVLFSYPPLHGWTLRSLMFPAFVRCAACDRAHDSVLVACRIASGEILCTACYGVSSGRAPLPLAAAVPAD
jgi:hypothetical protein